MVTLREYQEDSVNAIPASYRSGKRAPILVLPTGAGKTVCFSYIAWKASQKGSKVIVLVHRQELIYQTAEKFDKFGIEYGIISPEFPHTDHKIQIAMVQTLVRRLEKTDKPDLIIVDECHHAISGSYRKIIEWAGCRILGVTATPCRLDGRGLGEVFDDICIGVTTQDLIDMEYLSDYDYVSIPSKKETLQNLKIKMGDYTVESMKQVFDGVVPNIIASWESYAKNLPTICFCPSVETSKQIAEMFTNAGYLFKAIYGDMERQSRKDIIAQLANGEIVGITACDVVSEGTDIPVASCALLLRKTASTSLFLQQVGRVLRPVEGKRAKVIDMVQNYSQHGLPSGIRNWSLDGKIKKEPTKEKMCIECGFINKGTAKKCIECGAELNYKQCPECTAMVLSVEKKCPDCGHDFGRKAKLKQSDKMVCELKIIERFEPKHKKMFMKPLQDFLVSKGYQKGFAFYKMKLLESLGMSPTLATEEDWRRVYTTNEQKYSFESFVSYNKNLFKEFDKWQKKA